MYIDDLKFIKFAIRINTERECSLLMQLLEDNDYCWCDFWGGRSKPTTANDFIKPYENMCVELAAQKELKCNAIDCCLARNYAIISFDCFMRNTDLEYKPKEMTVKEIEKELGYKIKIKEK